MSLPMGLSRGSGLGCSGLFVVGAAIVTAVYLVSAPLLMLVVTAFRGPDDFLPFEPDAEWTLEHLRTIYYDPVLYQVTIPDTLTFVIGSVVCTFVIAFSLAWLVERTDLPWRNVLFTLILFPLLVPTIVLAIAWIYLFGPNAGWVNVALRSLLGFSGDGPLDVFTMPGLIACQSVALVPFVFLLMSATLRTMSPALEEASSTSGASPWTTFRRVTLPVLRPGMLAPLILTALITLEQFEMPLLVGLPARINVFSTRIFYELNPDTGLPIYGRAAAVALPFLVIGLLLLCVYNRLVREADRYVTVTGRGYRPRRLPLGQWRWPAFTAAVGYVGVTGILPAIVLIWISLYGYGMPSLDLLSDASLEAYRTVINDPVFIGATLNTLLVAGASAALVVVLGAVIGWVLARTRMPGRAILDVVSFASVGIPSVIAGLAAMLLYLTLPVALYGTVWVLILTYSYRLAVTTRMSRVGLIQIHTELEEASAMSGGRWLTTLRRVIFPLLAPTLVSGFVLLFIIGVREFTLAMILGSPDNLVLSVLLWRFFEDGSASEASAVASLIILLVVPVIFVLRRLVAPKAEYG